jgi:thiamine-phosphate pyrophosphorylase
MLLVISTPGPIADEAKLLNHLLDDGLEVLHLRKPGMSPEEMEKLVRQINPMHYSRIAVHQHHHLGKELGLRRFHFPVAERQKLGKAVEEWAGEERVLSTSIHRQLEYRELPPFYAYTFFGPVYASLSKPGYGPASGEEIKLPQPGERKTKIIALGGIEETNLEKTLAMGFDGVAVIGTLWQEPAQAVPRFKRLQRLLHKQHV